MKNKLLKTLSKLMTVMLTVMVTLSAAGVTSVFAEGTLTSSSKADITVEGLEEGVTVSAYKIIGVNVDDTLHSPKEPYYYWEDSVATWVSTNYPTYISNYKETSTSTLTDNLVTETFYNLGDDTQLAKEFNHALAAYLQNSIITAADSATAASVAAGDTTKYHAYLDGSDGTGLSAGYYLVIAGNEGSKIYTPTTFELLPESKSEGWSLNDIESTMKGSTPSITKTAEASYGESETELNSKAVSVAFDDTVEYKLAVTIPSYPIASAAMPNSDEDFTNEKQLSIRDSLPAGLDLVEGSLTIKDGSGNTFNTSNYTVAYTENKKGFLITFKRAYLKTMGKEGQELVIEYKAKVTTGGAQKDGLKNTATLSYYKDGGTTEASVTSEKEVYTYGVNIRKRSHDGTSLAGAAFTIYSSEPSTTESENESKKIKFNAASDTTTTENKKEVTTKVYDFSTTGTLSEVSAGDDGRLLLRGLKPGTYYLRETTAPTGSYQTPSSGYVKFVITDDTYTGRNEAGNTVSLNGADGNIDSAVVTTSGAYQLQGSKELIAGINGRKNILQFTVRNDSTSGKLTLPHTGGIGTTIFTVGGIVLMAGAVAYMVISKRKKDAD